MAEGGGEDGEGGGGGKERGEGCDGGELRGGLVPRVLALLESGRAILLPITLPTEGAM